MQVQALDGRTIQIERRWMPWRLHKRDLGDWPVDPFSGAGMADDPASFLFALVFGVVLALVGGIILTLALLASEALLLLLLVVPLFFAARMFWVLRWIIQIKTEDTVLGVLKVRGWRASEERIHELANAYRLGADPFTRT